MQVVINKQVFLPKP